jgi:hypothetical protein
VMGLDLIGGIEAGEVMGLDLVDGIEAGEMTGLDLVGGFDRVVESPRSATSNASSSARSSSISATEDWVVVTFQAGANRRSLRTRCGMNELEEAIYSLSSPVCYIKTQSDIEYELKCKRKGMEDVPTLSSEWRCVTSANSLLSRMYTLSFPTDRR